MPPQEDAARNSQLLVTLRILYMLNATSQYLLARTRHKVSVISIPQDENNECTSLNSQQTESKRSKPRYAKVSLRACLEVVCNASPELLSDRSRDYSVYVVDPSESYPAENTSHPQTIKDGVPRSPGDCLSVGMGLMSWCLAEGKAPSGSEDAEMDYVVGKFVKDRGVEALEIIISLRETPTKTQQQHALSLTSWGLPLPPMNTLDFHPSPNPQGPSPQAHTFNPFIPGAPCHEASMNKMPGGEISETNSSCPQEILSTDTTFLPQSSRPVEQPPRTKAKKTGRPPGSKTHPEKKARQVAIQMRKERLERLQNIFKMQNGEDYDKTLVTASDAEAKVTEEIIAREKKLLEELQSRPLIVDGPHFTTQPLPNRATSGTQNPLVEINTAKRSKTTSKSNIPALPASNTIEKEIVGGKPPAFSSTQATFLLSLLTSLLGKVDGPLLTDSAIPPGQGCEKSPGSQSGPPANLLPHQALQLNVHSADTPSKSLTNPGNDILVLQNAITRSQTTSQSGNSTVQRESLPLPFTTSGGSFHQYSGKSRQSSYNKQPITGDVLKVREDAYPVPGGGWARGKNIVPRAKAPSQIQGASSDNNIQENDNVSRLSAQPAITVVHKENMPPPPKSTRGLKRSHSSSTDDKENANATDVVPSRKGAKKSRQEDVARSTRTKAAYRAMMDTTENNNAAPQSRTKFAASSPVRSKVPTSSARSLPVVAVSEPDALLPRFFEPPMTASPINTASRNPPATTSHSDGAVPLIGESMPPDITTDPSVTTPRDEGAYADDADESLFTPCAPTSASQFVNESDGLLSSPSAGATQRTTPENDLTGRLSSRSQDAVLVDGARMTSRPVGTGWDLPPSSPPPPTSPINDLNAEESLAGFDLVTQFQSELDIEMEKTTDRRFEDNGKAIDSGETSHPSADVNILESDGMSHQLSTVGATSGLDASSDDVFDLGELGQVNDSDGIGLDIDELWSSLGPVISQTQFDSDSHTGIDFGLPSDQIEIPEEQSALDPVKLGEELKTLFGGCLL